jgi:elongation factor P
MYSVAQLKPGVAIIIDGDPYIVTKSEFSKQARQSGSNKCSLRNLKTGANIQQTFGGNDKAEPADLAKARCQFLYADGENCHFMHNETYEQFELSGEILGDTKLYLLEGGEVSVQFFDDLAIGLELPPKVVLEVADTQPGVKGNTAQGGSKPATMQTGLKISVPLFINVGDKIRINTDGGTYVERA